MAPNEDALAVRITALYRLFHKTKRGCAAPFTGPPRVKGRRPHPGGPLLLWFWLSAGTLRPSGSRKRIV